MAPPRKRARSSSIPSKDNYQNWTVDEVHSYLLSKGLVDVANCLKREAISGDIFHDLNDDRLKVIGITKLGKRLQLQKILNELKHSVLMTNHNYKIFNDPIHGHIEVHPLCINIMDTVQFQRLRQIKQLGCCYYVFPGASHNRFEHSIGVSHLAGKLARTLQQRQPDLDITHKDILCVEIAGLCHDLGHGPFSHMFDGIFIPLVDPESTWKHEKASVDMFDYLLRENNLKEKFREYELDDTDITFIKEQIYGPLEKEDKNKKYKGRPEKKKFLYEIVANKRNGIDVDKWDYFARDCHMLGIANSFDYNRFMKFAKVMEVDGEYQICTRDKEVGNLYDMFHTRNSLHRRAYQHKVNKIIETMIVEALVLANDHLLITGTNKRKLKMSEAIHDMAAYVKMTDNILYEILNTSDEKLFPARNIIANVMSRKLYRCIGQTSPKDNDPIPRAHIPKMMNEILGFQQDGTKQLNNSDLIIHVVDLNYGMGSDNPIDFVRFYSKHDPEQATMVRKSEVSHMLPEKFSEQQIRVYCKLRDDDESLQNAVSCFVQWCDSKQYKPKVGKGDPEITPFKKPNQPEEKQGRSRTRLFL
ncbi:deoxynucleoside triphosphate triphosphohydrolase SAMHD1-like [Antedon mediterranea]|uniref:deoxynucleoside triphosphate triphosphohydrolase SAMHD1-like n=1 Tax=Antedon mediterranea TaxID=105859 RepID=UPI003AF56965